MFVIEKIKEFRDKAEGRLIYGILDLFQIVDGYLKNKKEIDEIGSYRGIKRNMLDIFCENELARTSFYLNNLTNEQKKDILEDIGLDDSYMGELKELFSYINQKAKILKRKFKRKFWYDIEKREFKINNLPAIIINHGGPFGFRCGQKGDIDYDFGKRINVNGFEVFERDKGLVSHRFYRGSLNNWYPIRDSPWQIDFYGEVHSLDTLEKKYGERYREVFELEIKEFEKFLNDKPEFRLVQIDIDDSVDDVVKKTEEFPENSDIMFEYPIKWDKTDELYERLGRIKRYEL